MAPSPFARRRHEVRPEEGAAPNDPARPAARRGELGVGRSLLRFTLRVALGTALAVAVYLALARNVERATEDVSLRIPTRSPAIAPPRASTPPADVDARSAPEGRENVRSPADGGERWRDPSPQDGELVAPERTAAGGPPRPDLGPVALDVEARHRRGELADLQRRLRPCPDGDLRRHALVDEAQRVRKLTRERAGGVTVEEWFDEGGRLREARIRVTPERGDAWTRHLTLQPDGRETVDEAGPAPSGPSPLPALVRGDPTAALFAPPSCPAP